jgi:cell division protein FtsX
LNVLLNNLGVGIAVLPLVTAFLLSPGNCVPQNILVKIKAGQEAQTIPQLTALYNKYNPGLSFDYTFLDENYRRLYASEQRVAVLSRYFAGLAILISCLGLFGLAAFTAQRRRKEIGIRKVVGASIGRIAVMLTKDFLKLVGIAVLVAFPLARWLMGSLATRFCLSYSDELNHFCNCRRSYCFNFNIDR